MLPFRRLLAQRHLALFVCMVTLALKLLVPTGYMIGAEHGRIAIRVCSGTTAAAAATAMPGMDHAMPGNDKSPDHTKPEMPCAFAALSAAALGAVYPIQLASLIVFVVATGVMTVSVPAAIRRTHLRPPLRGPPTTL